MDEEEVFFEYIPSFDGSCTCDCNIDEHGWGNCGNELPNGEICPCEAGWNE